MPLGHLLARPYKENTETKKMNKLYVQCYHVTIYSVHNEYNNYIDG